LNHPEDWRLLLLKRAASACPLQSAATSRASFFLTTSGMTFVTGDEVHLVAFDRAFKLRFRFELNHTETQSDGHLMNVVLVQTKFPCDLLIRKVQAEQI
jgi:hypothetical protein